MQSLNFVLRCTEGGRALYWEEILGGAILRSALMTDQVYLEE